MGNLTTFLKQFLLFPPPKGVVGIVGKYGAPKKGQNGNRGKELKTCNGVTHD
jgi:hypothetical protein